MRDSHPANCVPFVNFGIIGLCVLTFMASVGSGNFEGVLVDWGFIPNLAGAFDVDTWRRVFASMFLHGGFMHIASNLWFLHIFGDNVEDRLGHIRYLFFYLLSGIAAIALQYVFSIGSNVPMIGASGAIAGVIGAYYVFFKNSRIETLIPTFGFTQIVMLPSTFVIGYWFVTQVFSGVGSLANFQGGGGGVAWFAHIGGFIFGYVAAKIINRSGV